MKINYENALNIMMQNDIELTGVVEKILESIPSRVIKQLNYGYTEGKGFKNGFVWEYQDDGKELNLNVDKVNSSSTQYASLNLVGISKKRLLEWSEHEGETLIGSVSLYLYKKGERGKKLKITYDYHMKFINGKYVVRVATNANTYIKEDEDILEHNGLKDIHRNSVGVTYLVDVKKITGEDRKSNKLI